MSKVEFRPGGEISAELTARGGDNLVAKRDLERYYHLLREALGTVKLSQGEALLICDACNGTMFEPHTMRLLWAEIDDAIRLDGLDEKWKVDGAALVEKLRALDIAQAVAVVDAVERFWQDTSGDPREWVIKVGLAREESN